MTPLQIEALNCLREWAQAAESANAIYRERKDAGTLYDSRSGALCGEYNNACNVELNYRNVLRSTALALLAMDAP